MSWEVEWSLELSFSLMMMVAFLLLTWSQLAFWSLGLFGATQRANPRYLSVRGCQAPKFQIAIYFQILFLNQFDNNACVAFLPGPGQSMLLEQSVFQSMPRPTGAEEDQVEPWGCWVPQRNLGNAMSYSIIGVRNVVPEFKCSWRWLPTKSNNAYWP